MKWFSFRRLLVAGFLLVLLLLSLVAWLIGSAYGRRRLEQLVRDRISHNSSLVVAPFDIEFSPWRDFPHVTASLRGLRLTDTTYHQPEVVLSINRADMRLELAGLLRSRVRVTRLVISGVLFQERTDSLGHSWGLHSKHRSKERGDGPGMTLVLDSLIVHNFRMRTRNEYAQSSFGASVRRASLGVRVQDGSLYARGALDAQIDYLRNSSTTLFEKEPVHAWANYRFEFKKRQGSFSHSWATLNEDTIQVSGTHTGTDNEKAGTRMNLRFEGKQPLMEVLYTALPPSLHTYLAGATSPSKAHIVYTISGLNGPTVSTRNVLKFALRGASLQWPDSTRRIDRWDLAGTYDNGPEQNSRTTSLTFDHCRIYSSAGQLNIAMQLRDFDHPFVNGRLTGRTELPELAAVVSPGLWRARHGTAQLDVRLRGLLPPPPGTRTAIAHQPSLSVQGSVALRNASFVLLDRGADMSELNVRIGLQNSVWQLSDASGVLDKMRFKAAATTKNLLDYLTGQQPVTSIKGNFTVDKLHISRLRELLRPLPLAAKPATTPGLARKRNKNQQTQHSTNLGPDLFPPGLRLDVSLRCQQLLLPTDTLRHLAVTVRHDGRQVQLSNLAGDVWGGQVRGQVRWSTDTTHRVAPVDFEVGVHFATINYQHLLAKMSRPPQRSTKAPTSPALRELLLAANGHITCTIDAVQLSSQEHLRNLQVRFDKQENKLRMPYLRFNTTRGGQGNATAWAQVAGNHLKAADASLDLRYATLDVQELLKLLASINPAGDDDESTAQPVANVPKNRQAAAAMLADGSLTAMVRVQAAHVRYASLTGSDFRLVSRLRDGAARLDDCSLNAFQGKIQLRGFMRTNAGRRHHPLHVQALLDNIQLSELFTAATAMNLNIMKGDNVRGSMHCAADVRTDLNADFLPDFDQTLGYLRTDLRDLELMDVEALTQTLRFLKDKRTNHLYFEPVSTRFILDRGQLLIPSLHLNSNLSDLHISGRYGLDGRSDLYIGLSPLQALFGNNEKRIARIQSGEAAQRPSRALTYVNLKRPSPGAKYNVRLFKKSEQRQQQAALRKQYQQLLLTQRLDTTLRLLR
ncbi:AsmA-like C-terminal region-containing protein [Hymenobacter sp. GOD-10R]|uniref:AsmA-like C-terminal region-containing protein n=1 Tax=Hymenobacter sp. GOD-10R TaxID=3093922 RepID=UPI002D786625|nr:AsmA-like C-terminal region-containing protein [Hymenobacter sp. GOD-10R]WRQ30391.1 AsmA-like C-terminal region-containing protein [Hymenobacter sp. GOD-10R]